MAIRIEGLRELVEMAGKSSFASDFVLINHAYVDITGDLVCGAMLSRIVYWFGRSTETGRLRASLVRDGRLWIAKRRKDWWDEIRITEKQVRRATEVLVGLGLIVTKTYKFNGAPTTFISLNAAELLKRLAEWEAEYVEKAVQNSIDEDGNGIADITIAMPGLPKGPNGYGPKGNLDMAQRAESITKSTTKDTANTHTVLHGELTSKMDAERAIVENNSVCVENSRNVENQDAAPTLDHGVERIIDSWPRQIGGDAERRRARDSIAEAVASGVDMARIAAGATAYSAWVREQGIEARYVKSLSRWVADGCYNDSYDVPAGGTTIDSEPRKDVDRGSDTHACPECGREAHRVYQCDRPTDLFECRECGCCHVHNEETYKGSAKSEWWEDPYA